MRYGIILTAFLLFACNPLAEETFVILRGPSSEEIKIEAEFADTDEERREGLMHRTALEEGHGMLFLFDDEAERWFWMKDTLIPLDVLFFDTALSLVSTQSMEPCTPDVCSMYGSQGPARYALEVNAGFVEEHGIDDTWTLEIHQ